MAAAFTISLFIGLLAFDKVELQNATKIGVIVGSGLSGLLRWLVLMGGRPIPPPNRV